MGDELRATLNEKLKEIQSVKAELTDLVKQIAASTAPKELEELRRELEQLQEEQRLLAAEEEKMPDQYRYDFCEASQGRRHLHPGDPLFPPGSEEERENGRIRVLLGDERICYPTPFESGSPCGVCPKVLAKVRCKGAHTGK
jgi:hypothetical protein